MTDEKDHILVVDDELSMREPNHAAKRGVFSCAENGKAVAFLKKEKVDLLISDINGIMFQGCQKRTPMPW
jgi:CheY-like chemotaxis protein